MTKEAFSDRIILTGMTFFGKTGYFDFEKVKGQAFRVDLTLYFHKLRASDTDDLQDTVDYGAVFEMVRCVVEGGKFNLIEKLASEILREVLIGFPADAVEVTVHKPEAPIPGSFEAMSVCLYRERNVNEEEK